MSIISREQFLKLGKAERRYKTVPLGNVEFRIQSLTEKEKARYETDLLAKGGGFNSQKLRDARLRLVILCLVDSDGERMLAESDLKTLHDMDGGLVSRLVDECRDHCGFDSDDIEDAVKNSSSIRVEDSPSD